MSVDTPNKTAPIFSRNADIQQALTDAHDQSLRMALIQITRDETLLSERYADRETLHHFALEVIAGIRDGVQSVATDLPDATSVYQMMQTMVDGEIPKEYVPMMMQEMSLTEPDRWYEDIPAEKRAELKVAVIGAGLSGILAAIRLQEAGIPFVVFEKNYGEIFQLQK